MERYDWPNVPFSEADWERVDQPVKRVVMRTNCATIDGAPKYFAQLQMQSGAEIRLPPWHSKYFVLCPSNEGLFRRTHEGQQLAEIFAKRMKWNELNKVEWNEYQRLKRKFENA